jgi:hypothetical protein
MTNSHSIYINHINTTMLSNPESMSIPLHGDAAASPPSQLPLTDAPGLSCAPEPTGEKAAPASGPPDAYSTLSDLVGKAFPSNAHSPPTSFDDIIPSISLEGIPESAMPDLAEIALRSYILMELLSDEKGDWEVEAVYRWLNENIVSIIITSYNILPILIFARASISENCGPSAPPFTLHFPTAFLLFKWGLKRL